MRIFTLIGIVFLVVGGFFAYQAWFTPASDNPFDFGKAAAPIVAVTFLIIGFTFTIVGSVILRLGRARQQLLATGLIGRAEIVSATQTSMYVNDQPVVQLQLNVTVPGRLPYPVSHREVVPLLALAMIQPGHVLTVAVDPTNANKLAIDWGGMTSARAPSPAAPMPLPNTLGQMPNIQGPMPGVPGQMPGIAGSRPIGSEGGVGFAAPAGLAAPTAFPPPTAFAMPLGTTPLAAPATTAPADGMAAYLSYLRTSGIPGRAVLRTVQDTGVTVRGDEVLMLQLDVSPAGGVSYPVTTTAMLAQAWIGRAVPGASVAVYIDRTNPQAVAIDWEAA